VDEGVLPEEVAREVRAHLADCDICVQLRNDLNTLSESIATEPFADRMPPGIFRRKISWWVYGAFAAAAALVVIWPRPQATPVRPTEPSAPVKYRLPLEQAKLRLPLASALTLRGAQSSSSSAYLKDLGIALEPYRAGNFAEAAVRLRTLQASYPQAVEPPFYLGVSQLLDGHAQASIPSFEQAQRIGGEALNEDVAWYLAVARERSGGWEPIKPFVEQLCKGSGEHRQAACEALSK